MILKRTLTAAIGIPAVYCVIQYSNRAIFLVFVLIIAAFALTEFFRMAMSQETVRERTLGICLGCCVLMSVFLDSHVFTRNASGLYFFSIGCCALSVAVLFLYYMFFERTLKNVFNKIAVHFFGIFYIALLFSHVILIRARPDGIQLIFFLLSITWVGDSAAYIIGSWIGRRPLCPHISPKKTVEGAIGSCVAGIVVTFLLRSIFLNELSGLHCLALGIGINFFNQFGDLTESVMKRTFGVKDSGTFLPGHGGILDRIDSLLFAAPFLFYYTQIVIPTP